MPKVKEENLKFYDGAEEKIKRLGLAPLWKEVLDVITGFELLVMEKKHANGGAVVRERFDERFAAIDGWTTIKSGGVDWMKSKTVNGTRLCVGVEVQVSIRSDLLIIDVSHLRDMIQEGKIDVGVIIVPSDALGYFLTDRAPRFSMAVKTVERAFAQWLPLVVIGIDHDGPGEALPKKITNRGEGKKKTKT